MREAQIQTQGVNWLRAEPQRCICIKLSVVRAFGTRGWPDYLVLAPRNKHFFIEYKAPGEKLTPLQARRMRELLDLGHKVFVCHSLEATKSAYSEVCF